MRRFGAAAWLGAMACIAGPLEASLDVPAGAQTLILIVESKAKPLATELRDLSTGALLEPLTMQPGDAYYALFYDESIATLGLEGLALVDQACPDGVPLRTLPEPSASRGRRLEADGLVTISDEALTALLGRVWRLEGFETGCAPGAWSRLDVAADACSSTWEVEIDRAAMPIPPEPPSACAGACSEPGFGTRHACGRYEAHFLGSPGCEPIGGGCPAGDVWPTLPPDTYWVEAGGSGDGRASAPSGDLPGIVAMAPSGATIAILGTLPLVIPLEIDRDLTIVGLCPERSRIEGTLHSHADLRLEHLTLGGANVGARVPSGHFELVGVLLEGDASSSTGIFARGPASIAIEGSVLRHWRNAVDIVDRVTGTIERTNLLDFAYGVTVNSTSSLRLDQVAFDARERPPLEPGWGVLVLGGSAANLQRALVDGASTWGLIARGRGRLEVSDAVIRDLTGQWSSALHVTTGTLTSTRVAVEGQFGTGVVLLEGASGRVVDLTLDGQTRGGQVAAVVLESASRIEIERARLRSPGFGNGLKLGSGVLHQRLTDVEIDGIDAESVELGSAINTGNSMLVAKRLWIHDWAATGLDLKDGGVLNLRDGTFERIIGAALQLSPMVVTSSIVVDRVRAEDVGSALKFDSGVIRVANIEIVGAQRAFHRHAIFLEFQIEVDRFHAQAEESVFSLGEPGVGVMAFSRGRVEAPSASEVLRATESCLDPRRLFSEVGTMVTRP